LGHGRLRRGARTHLRSPNREAGGATQVSHRWNTHCLRGCRLAKDASRPVPPAPYSNISIRQRLATAPNCPFHKQLRPSPPEGIRARRKRSGSGQPCQRWVRRERRPWRMSATIAPSPGRRTARERPGGQEPALGPGAVVNLEGACQVTRYGRSAGP
jgi:hypothetical protein